MPENHDPVPESPEPEPTPTPRPPKAKGDEGTIDIGKLFREEPDDPENPISGSSLVDWADFVQQRQDQQKADLAGTPPDDALKYDSVSDKDILRRVQQQPDAGTSDVPLGVIPRPDPAAQDPSPRPAHAAGPGEPPSTDLVPLGEALPNTDVVSAVPLAEPASVIIPTAEPVADALSAGDVPVAEEVPAEPVSFVPHVAPLNEAAAEAIEEPIQPPAWPFEELDEEAAASQPAGDPAPAAPDRPRSIADLYRPGEDSDSPRPSEEIDLGRLGIPTVWGSESVVFGSGGPPEADVDVVDVYTPPSPGSQPDFPGSGDSAPPDGGAAQVLSEPVAETPSGFWSPTEMEEAFGGVGTNLLPTIAEIPPPDEPAPVEKEDTVHFGMPPGGWPQAAAGASAIDLQTQGPVAAELPDVTASGSMPMPDDSDPDTMHLQSSAVDLAGEEPIPRPAGLRDSDAEPDFGEFEPGPGGTDSRTAVEEPIVTDVWIDEDPASAASGEVVTDVWIDEEPELVPSDADVLAPAAAAPARAAPGVPAPARPRSRTPALAGGLAAGLLIGVAGLGAAWYGGLLPAKPDDLFGRSDLAKGVTPKGAEKADAAAGADKAPAPSATRARDLLAGGDVDGALAVMGRLDKAVADSPAVKAMKGQATAVKWLRDTAQKGQMPDKDDPQLKEAQADLQTAARTVDESGARAQLWLGLIEEATNNPAAARTLYEQGRNRYVGHERMFNAALDRINSRPGPDPGRAAADRPDPAAALALLLVQLQADGAADGDEPAQKFWEAMRLAKNHDYDRAIAALREARGRHDLRRFAAPGARLNPVSDPLDEGFLRACDELLVYLDLRKELYNNPDGKKLAGDPVKALAAVVAARPAGGNKEAEEALRAAAERLKAEKLDGAKLPEAIDELVKRRKTAEEGLAKSDQQFAGLAKKLKDLGIDAARPEEGVEKLTAGRRAAEDREKAVLRRLSEAGIRTDDAVKGVDQLAAARRDLDNTVQAVAARLREAKLIEDRQDREALVQGMDRALQTSATPGLKAVAQLATELVSVGDTLAQRALPKLGMAVRLAAAEAEGVRARLALNESRTPAQMLDVWLAALADRNARSAAGPALADAEKVLADEDAGAAAKAKALAVKGLALATRGEPAEARSVLRTAAAHPGFAKEQDWAKAVGTAAKEVADPESVARAAEELLARRKPAEALALIETGLKTFPAADHPKENGRLLAARAMVKLEQNDPAGAAADAEAAIAQAPAEGNYAAARAAERVGDRARAERHYRAVLKAVPAENPLAARARLSLGRLLLQRGGTAPGVPAAERAARADDPAALAALILVLLADPVTAGPPAIGNLDEVERLADEAIRLGQPEGHLLKAQVLSARGSHTAAVKEAIRGLKLAHPGPAADAVESVLSQHPGIRRGDPAASPRPVLAERRFNRGLDLYVERRYAEAEREFAAAITLNDRDARYYYMGGMARLQQGRAREAADDFRRGAELEARNQPNPQEVEASLERVQGAARRVLEDYRRPNKP